MKRLPTNERFEVAEFEGLEPRLLLAAAPFIQPDGPMPQAAGPGCGPPVAQEETDAADADGDGKLGLADVPTHGAPEPTSLTFNGRGIDLNDDGQVDALADSPSEGEEAGEQSGYDFDFDFDEWVWFGQNVRDGFAESLPDDPMAAGGGAYGLTTQTRPHMDGVQLTFQAGDAGIWDDMDMVHAFAETLPDDLYRYAVTMAADADGDGKLGLADVPTHGAPEPTSLTFNGRGIDLNEDGKVDVQAEASFARDGKITPWERVQLAWSTEPPVPPAAGLTGAPAFLRGRVVDLAFWGVERTIWAASYDFGPAGEGLPAGSQPTTYIVLDFPWPDEWAAPGLPVQPETAEDYCYCMCPYNLFAEVSGLDGDGLYKPEGKDIDTLSDRDGVITRFERRQIAGTAPWIGGSIYVAGGAGHCKIMAVRVANPEASAAGGPLGAIMGGPMG